MSDHHTEPEAEVDPISGRAAADAPTAGMTRRHAMALVGGGLAAVAARVEAGHPLQRHLHDHAAIASAHGAAALPDWTPSFFSEHQYRLLGALAERIVPRSGEAQVARFVDALADVETREAQKRLLLSLAAFEAAALARFGRPFAALAGAEQDEVLEGAAELERARPRDTSWSWFAVPASPGAGAPDLGGHLRHLKGWVSGAYYSSEIGMRELGWTGVTPHDAFPGCTHPEHGAR
jgi:hypothetical protein